jgi:predicted anti-sigma-YlaC factor YlaD
MNDHLTCLEFVDRIAEEFDGVLSPEDRLVLETHRQECDGCRRFYVQMSLVRYVTGRVMSSVRAPDVPFGLMKAFRDWKRERGAS